MSTTFNFNGGDVVGGRSVVIDGDKIVIDGREITGDEKSKLLNGRDIVVEINVLSGSIENLTIQRGSARVKGDVGKVNAGSSVTCDNVEGSVSAGSSVTCGNVGGNVSAGSSVKAQKVDGNIIAGGSVSVKS